MIAPSASRDRISLAGAWQLAFDLAAKGLGRGGISGAWSDAEADTVQVLASWDVNHPAARGIGYY